jgi:hypothetical protein
MTLVIAQRQKDKVSLSADSRLTIEGTGFDSAIKVFSVPFRLRGITKSPEDRDKWEFEYHFGVAIIGSTLNAYTVKESIREVLANLQYPTNASDVSMIGIGHLILKVYEDVSDQLASIMRERGLSEIIVAGYCIIKKRIRFLRFYFDMSLKIEYKFEEILIDEGLAFFGSGRKVAEKIYESNKDLSPLEIVKYSIDSGENNTIGGPPQHGFFKEKNFKVSGVYEKIVDEKKGQVTTKHFLRGIRFEQDISKPEYPLLFLSYSYMPITPFKKLEQSSG